MRSSQWQYLRPLDHQGSPVILHMRDNTMREYIICLTWSCIDLTSNFKRLGSCYFILFLVLHIVFGTSYCFCYFILFFGTSYCFWYFILYLVLHIVFGTSYCFWYFILFFGTSYCFWYFILFLVLHIVFFTEK